MTLPKYERKIRMRVAKRVKYMESTRLPQASIIKKFIEFWVTIEKWIRNNRYKTV